MYELKPLFFKTTVTTKVVLDISCSMYIYWIIEYWHVP